MEHCQQQGGEQPASTVEHVAAPLESPIAATLGRYATVVALRPPQATPPGEADQHHSCGISIRPLPACELPATPPAEQARICPEDRQLCLDLIWALDRRPNNADGRVELADAQSAQRLVIAIAEALEGRRPVKQVAGYLDARVAAAVRTWATSRALEGLHLQSLHLSQPAHDIIEACGTVTYGQHARALVARLQAFDRAGNRQWVCRLLRLL
jgi:hypothetical protein